MYTWTCQQCGLVFEHKCHTRKFCSAACQNKAARGKSIYPPGTFQPRVCKICGKLFEKPRNVSAAKWAKRQTCSRKCGRVLAAHKCRKCNRPHVDRMRRPKDPTPEEIARLTAEIRAGWTLLQENSHDVTASREPFERPAMHMRRR